MITLLCSVFILIASASASFGQQRQVQSREIISEDFTRNRPPPSAPKSTPAKKPAAATPASKRKRVYKLAATLKLNRRPQSSAPVASSSGVKVEQVGITVWRLRPSRATDAGARILIQDGAVQSYLTPERVSAEVPLARGELVRLSIESPRNGYLYVIDREQYSDGTLGKPMLIFPTTRTRGGDNHVGAGILVDIPDQADTPPYFTLNSNKAGYVGDLLTVIVTPTALDEITIGRSALALTTQQVEKWERMWGAETERFELEGGAGATWTPEERDASVRNGRALTQDEPTPQTIYSVSARPNSPLLISVALRAAR